MGRKPRYMLPQRYQILFYDWIRVLHGTTQPPSIDVPISQGSIHKPGRKRFYSENLNSHLPGLTKRWQTTLGGNQVPPRRRRLCPVKLPIQLGGKPGYANQTPPKIYICASHGPPATNTLQEHFTFPIPNTGTTCTHT